MNFENQKKKKILNTFIASKTSFLFPFSSFLKTNINVVLRKLIFFGQIPEISILCAYFFSQNIFTIHSSLTINFFSKNNFFVFFKMKDKNVEEEPETSNKISSLQSILRDFFHPAGDVPRTLAEQRLSANLKVFYFFNIQYFI